MLRQLILVVRQQMIKLSTSSIFALWLALSGMGMLLVSYWLSLSAFPTILVALSVLSGFVLFVLAARISPAKGLRTNTPKVDPEKTIHLSQSNNKVEP